MAAPPIIHLTHFSEAVTQNPHTDPKSLLYYKPNPKPWHYTSLIIPLYNLIGKYKYSKWITGLSLLSDGHKDLLCVFWIIHPNFRCSGSAPSAPSLHLFYADLFSPSPPPPPLSRTFCSSDSAFAFSFFIPLSFFLSPLTWGEGGGGVGGSDWISHSHTTQALSWFALCGCSRQTAPLSRLSTRHKLSTSMGVCLCL